MRVRREAEVTDALARGRSVYDPIGAVWLFPARPGQQPRAARVCLCELRRVLVERAELPPCGLTAAEHVAPDRQDDDSNHLHVGRWMGPEACEFIPAHDPEWVVVPDSLPELLRECRELVSEHLGEGRAWETDELDIEGIYDEAAMREEWLRDVALGDGPEEEPFEAWVKILEWEGTIWRYDDFSVCPRNVPTTAHGDMPPLAALDRAFSEVFREYERSEHGVLIGDQILDRLRDSLMPAILRVAEELERGREAQTNLERASGDLFAQLEAARGEPGRPGPHGPEMER